MQKPFDVSTLMEGIDAEDLETTYDKTGKGTGPTSLPRRSFDVHDSPSASQRPTNDLPAPAEDAINPAHYRKHPSGIECIEVTRHMNFNTGNAIKYIWRYLDKGDPVENLKKAQWYIDDEIRRLQGMR